MNIVAILDDREDCQKYIQQSLIWLDCKIVQYRFVARFLQAISRGHIPQVLILDYFLDGDMTAQQVIFRIQEMDPDFFSRVACIGYSSVVSRSSEIAELTGGLALHKNITQESDHDLRILVASILISQEADESGE